MSYVEDSVSMHQPGAVLTSRIDDSASIHTPQVAPTSRSRFSALIGQLRFAPTSNFEDLLAAIRENQRKTTLSGAAVEGEENPRQTDQIQMDKIMADQAQMGAAKMGMIIRRTQNINAFDGPRGRKHSDAEQFPGYSSPAESVSGVNFAENRLLHPDEYFRELDDLGSEVFKKSMFHFYTVSCNS
jgi:Mg2+/Co2+ transporter CorC